MKPFFIILSFIIFMLKSSFAITLEEAKIYGLTCFKSKLTVKTIDDLFIKVIDDNLSINDYLNSLYIDEQNKKEDRVLNTKNIDILYFYKKTKLIIQMFIILTTERI